MMGTPMDMMRPPPDGPPERVTASPPARRRRGARWLLRQLLFWLMVAIIPVAIWKIVTWPVGLPAPR